MNCAKDRCRLRSLFVCGIILVATGFMAGCLGMPETRWLSCRPRPAAAETRSYNLHDPFPDESAGPNTFSRPRAFDEPRTDTRRDSDLRFLQSAFGYPPHKYADRYPVGTFQAGGTTQMAGPYVQPPWQVMVNPTPLAEQSRFWSAPGQKYDVVRPW